MTSLTPRDRGGISNKDVRTSLIEASEFSKKANEDEMVKRGPALIKILQAHAAHYQKWFPPQISLEQIASEFNDICLENKDVYSWGLEYSWLQKVVDCSNMGLPADLPFHARIGLGHHAGFASVEEEFLLGDAFFILALAEKAYENMHAYARYWKESNKPDDPELVGRIFGTANQNVATYCRLSILSFFSFVEAFVNSVGYDFSLRNKGMLAARDIEILRGTKGGRYLSLARKIERFPAIIRADKKSPIILSDPKQIREPFQTFIDEITEIRDSSLHYSPRKEAIWRRPDDWIDGAKSTAKCCLEVSVEFWKACYPDRKEPQYLSGLDYGKHVDIAGKRLELKDKIGEHRGSSVA